MLPHRSYLLLAAALWIPACGKKQPTPTPAAPETSERASGADTAAAAPLPDRDVALAKSLIQGEGALVLDVRTQDEWDVAHYEGATLIPHTDLEARIDEVVRAVGDDRSRPVVVYCRSGGRAGTARTVLETYGFTRVTNVGGLVDLCPECMPTTEE